MKKRKHPGHRLFNNDDVFGKKKKSKLGKKKRAPANQVSLEFRAHGVHMPHQNLRAAALLKDAHVAGNNKLQRGHDDSNDDDESVSLQSTIINMTTARNLTLKDIVQQFSHYNPSVVRGAVQSMRELCKRHTHRLLHTQLHIIVRESAPLIIYDLDGSVRREIAKLYEMEVFPMVEESRMRPFMATFVTYVVSGLTHIEAHMRLDALDILELLLQKYGSTVVQFVARLMPVLEECFDLSEHMFNMDGTSYRRLQWRTMSATSLLIRCVLDHRDLSKDGSTSHVLLRQPSTETSPSSSSDSCSDVRLDSVHEDDHNVHIKMGGRDRMMNNLMEVTLVRRAANQSARAASTSSTTATNNLQQKDKVGSLENHGDNTSVYRMERVEHVAHLFMKNLSQHWIKLWIEYSRSSRGGEMIGVEEFKMMREILDVMHRMVEWVENEEKQHSNDRYHLRRMMTELQRWYEHLLDGSHFPIVGSSLLRKPERSIVVGANVRYTALISQVVRWGEHKTDNGESGNDDVQLFRRMMRVMVDLLQNETDGCSLMADDEWDVFVRTIERVHGLMTQPARDLVWKLLMKQVTKKDCSVRRKHIVMMMFCRVVVATSRSNQGSNQRKQMDKMSEEEGSNEQQSIIPEAVVQWWISQLAHMLCEKDASANDRSHIIDMMSMLVQNGNQIELLPLFATAVKDRKRITSPLVTIMNPQQQSRLIHLLYFVDQSVLIEPMIRALTELCCSGALSGEHMMQLMQVLRFQFETMHNLDASLLTSMLMLVTVSGICARENMSWSLFEDLVREVIMSMRAVHRAKKLNGAAMTRWLLSQMEKRSSDVLAGNNNNTNTEQQKKRKKGRGKRQPSDRMMFGLLTLWTALSEWGALETHAITATTTTTTPQVVVEWLWMCQHVDLIKQLLEAEPHHHQSTIIAMLQRIVDRGTEQPLPTKVNVPRLVELARITCDHLYTVARTQDKREAVLQQWRDTIAWIRQHATRVLTQMDDLHRVSECETIVLNTITSPEQRQQQ